MKRFQAQNGKKNNAMLEAVEVNQKDYSFQSELLNNFQIVNSKIYYFQKKITKRRPK